MRLLGLEITRAKALPTAETLSSVTGRGWNRIFEAFPGAWQRNVEINMTEVTSHSAVFACMTLIAGDVSKLGSPDFKRLNGKIWEVSSSPAYDPVLREPNQFQTANQFWEQWVLSKLWKGNTYALKGRDERKVVRRLWILDPCRVTPLVSESGDVFYQIMQDNISGVKEAGIVLPQSEIIHDRMNPLFHPLVGISPLYAAGLAAQMGLNISQEGAIFFKNRRIPGGILTSPHTITDETADRLQREWIRGDTENIGRTRVLGDGLEFKTTTATASDSQMLELAKATAEWVCSVFHVPPYMIGIGTPISSAVEALSIYYYSQAIQKQLEDIEACLVRGLEMKAGTKVEFDTDGLLRMDTVSLVQSVRDAVGAGVMAPDEGRAKLGLSPVAGGASPYLQQQNYSLAALAKRDAQDDPFKTEVPPPQQIAPPDEPEPEPEGETDDDSEDTEEKHIGLLTKGLHREAA